MSKKTISFFPLRNILTHRLKEKVDLLNFFFRKGRCDRKARVYILLF